MGNHDHNNGILLASVFRYPVKSLEGEALDDVVLTVGARFVCPTCKMRVISTNFANFSK